VSYFVESCAILQSVVRYAIHDHVVSAVRARQQECRQVRRTNICRAHWNALLGSLRPGFKQRFFDLFLLDRVAYPNLEIGQLRLLQRVACFLSG